MERAADSLHSYSSKGFSICALLLGLLLGAAAIWGANKQSLGLYHDDGIYVVVAKAISLGDGYRIISLPTSPAQTKYPFLYSYILAGIWSVTPDFPGNIVWLKALNAIVLVAIFFFAVAFYRRVVPTARIGALVFAAIVCTNPILFTFTDFPVSDLLFVLLALAALYVARGPATRAKGMALAVITGLACLTRLAAAPLVLAGAAPSLLRREWRGTVYFIAAVVLLVAPWFGWVSLNRAAPAHALFDYYSAYDFASGSYGGIGDWLSFHGPIVAANARYLWGSFDFLYLLPLLPPLLPLIVLFTLLGMIVCQRREDVFAWIFLLSSGALLLLWPFNPLRYVAPLVPLLVLFLFRGMAAAERWIDTARADYALKLVVAKTVWLPAVLLLVLNSVWLSSYLLIRDEQTSRSGYGSRVPYGWTGFEESFAWIRQHTASDARLGTAYDPMYFLYTGRQAIRPALHRSATYFYPYGQAKPDVGSVAEIKSGLEVLRIDYLIIDPLDSYAEGRATLRLLGELIAAYGSKARHVFTSSDGKHKIYALGRP